MCRPLTTPQISDCPLRPNLMRAPVRGSIARPTLRRSHIDDGYARCRAISVSVCWVCSDISLEAHFPLSAAPTTSLLRAPWCAGLEAGEARRTLAPVFLALFLLLLGVAQTPRWCFLRSRAHSFIASSLHILDMRPAGLVPTGFSNLLQFCSGVSLG